MAGTLWPREEHKEDSLELVQWMDTHMKVKGGGERQGQLAGCLCDTRVLFVIIRFPTLSFWSPGLMFFFHRFCFSVMILNWLPV